MLVLHVIFFASQIYFAEITNDDFLTEVRALREEIERHKAED